MRTTIMLLLAAAAVSACCAADYDGYVSLRGDGSWVGVPAFMTNVVDLAQGWDDERDPHGDADYVVKGSTCLATPSNVTTATCYEFPGRTLTIDTTFDASRGIRFYTSQDASVKFKSLTLRGGVIQLFSPNSWAQTIRGNVVVDLSDKDKPFRIKGGTAGQSWHFREGTLSSGCDDVIESSVDYSVKPVHYWVHDDVDASGYCGTFRVWWSKVLHVECPRFGGTAEASSTGVVSYAASGVSISNVWLSAKGAKLTFDAANMNGYADHLEMTNGSTVAFLAGTTLTVGTLDYQGGTLDFTKGGLLALTNGYSRTELIEIVVPLASSAMRTAALVTLPITAGTLRAEDFTASQTVGNCQYQFRVRTVGGLQSLYLENLLPCGTSYSNYSNYQNSDYYVHQIKGGYTGSSAPQNVFSLSGAWSNKTDGVSVAVPTTAEAADLDYEGVRLGFWDGQNVDFKGRSFTYSGYPIRASANNMMYTFPDMRVFSGTSQNYLPTFYCSGNNPNVTFKGMMTVLCRATDSYPLSISPVNTDNNSYGVFNVEMKVVGDSGSLFRLCDYKDRAAVGAATNVVKFTGDMSAYAGTIDVKKNVRMTLGGNATEMPGTVLIEDASSRLSLDGISATVGTLRTADAALIEVPEGNTLTVSDAIDLADGTSLAMTAGEPALDLSSCESLSFGGKVNVSVEMDRSVETTPVAVAKDMSAAGSVMSAFCVLCNGRTPMELSAEPCAAGVLVSASRMKGLSIFVR